MIRKGYTMQVLTCEKLGEVLAGRDVCESRSKLPYVYETEEAAMQALRTFYPDQVRFGEETVRVHKVEVDE